MVARTQRDKGNQDLTRAFCPKSEMLLLDVELQGIPRKVLAGRAQLYLVSFSPQPMAPELA